MILLVWTMAALGAGASADVELLRPSFSLDGLPGVDSPEIDEGGTVRIGTFLQYERDPLILYQREQEQGVVISNRQALHLGVSWDLSHAASVRLIIPAMAQSGTEIPELARDGVGLGDLRGGLRLKLLGGSHAVHTAVRADTDLPTSTPQAWMGEAQPRLTVGSLTSWRIHAIDLLADLAVQARPSIPTDQDFVLGSEFAMGLGARYNLVPERASLGLGVLARGGVTHLGQGGAENSSELTTSLQLHPQSDLTWVLGAGKGLSSGYGTTEFRAFTGLTWTRHRSPPAPIPQLVISQVPEQVAVPVIDNPDEIWEEDELARVEGEQIVIRDPIQFEFATDHILPQSQPTLRQVAQLLNDKDQIAHVVIEGHASEEGSDEYNYDLSERRAQAVWKALIEVGVHPDRLSYRGMGETVPKVQGDDEASLAANRRVEFHIIRQWAPGETHPPVRTDVRLPWNGEPFHPITQATPATEESATGEAPDDGTPDDALPDDAPPDDEAQAPEHEETTP